MVIKYWFDFTPFFAGLACGLFLLFEGTRRFRVHRLKPRTALLVGSGVLACLAYIGTALSFQSSFTRLAHLETYTVPTKLPDGWGANMPPEKREEYSLMIARAQFNQAGTFREYFDRDGMRKTYSPTEKDIRDRDILHSAQDQFAILARVGLRDGMVMLALMLASIIGGVLASRVRVE
jgi:hypothetical protein